MEQYKYETHCHTAQVSACSRLSAQDIVHFYQDLGYQGVFITDHFLNGNTTIPKDLPWEERIRRFVDGYREVKEVGDRVGLDVFFGFESSYWGTDFLVYGLDEEWLKRNEACFSWKTTQMLKYMRAEGGLVIQAHPFREADYIDHIRLFPSDVDGIEVFNAGRDERCNRLGDNLADEYSLLKTAGSDLHSTLQPVISGMSFPKKIKRVSDFIEMLKGGDGKIIR